MKLWIIMILVSGSAMAEKFPGLSRLKGQCYQATFPDGNKIDTHCFADMYQGGFIEDDHLVCGDGKDYRGKTIYAVESGSEQVIYRYHNSMGGFSDGSVVFNGSELHFPEEVYQQADGSSQTYRTVWQLNESGYVSIMDHQQKDGTWRPVWKMIFKQVPKNNQITQADGADGLICAGE